MLFFLNEIKMAESEWENYPYAYLPATVVVSKAAGNLKPTAFIVKDFRYSFLF
jgi:hypothetical protein